MGKNKLGTAYVEVKADYDKYSKSLIGLRKESKDSAKNMENSFSKATKSLGGMISQIGLAVVAFASLKKAISTASSAFIQLDSGMRNANTILRQSEQSLGNFKEGILKIYRETGKPIADLTNALYQTASAGIEASKAMKFVETASKGAIAGVAGITEAVDFGTNVINAWKISVDDAGQIFDAAFKAVEKGKTTFSELSSAISIVSAVASDAGISFQDILGAVATLTKRGISTSVAMTQLRQAIIIAREEMGDSAFVGRNFAEVLDDVARGWGYSFNTIKAEGGRIEGVNGILALTGKNLQEAKSDADALANSFGSMGTAYEEQSKALEFAINRLKAAFTIALINGFELLLPLIKEATEYLTDLGDKGSESFKKFKEDIDGVTLSISFLLKSITFIGKSVAIVSNLVTAGFWSFMDIINTIVTTLNMFKGAFVGTFKTIGSVADRFFFNFQESFKKAFKGDFSGFGNMFEGLGEEIAKNYKNEFDIALKIGKENAQNYQDKIDKDLSDIANYDLLGMNKKPSNRKPAKNNDYVQPKINITPEEVEEALPEVQTTETDPEILTRLKEQNDAKLALEKEYRERLEEIRDEYNELIATSEEDELERLKEQYEKDVEMFKDNEQAKAEIKELYDRKQADIQKKYDRIKLNSAIQTASAFSQLMDVFQGQSKVLFNIGKASAIAETIISTYKAAQEAYAVAAKIDPFILAPAAATAATVAGLGRVAKIKSQNYGAAATGADFVTNGAGYLLVGDNPGGKERVQVNPIGSKNVNGNLANSNDLSEMIRELVNVKNAVQAVSANIIENRPTIIDNTTRFTSIDIAEQNKKGLALKGEY